MACPRRHIFPGMRKFCKNFKCPTKSLVKLSPSLSKGETELSIIVIKNKTKISVDREFNVI